jgi:lysine-N-methylase
MMSMIALQYMSRFACLGADCEDSCCVQWTVHVDEAHYFDLRARMAAAGEGERFEAAFVLKPEAERQPWGHATIRLREGSARCPLLDDGGLCSIHSRWGEAALPDVCSYYPRRLTVLGERRELSGSLSCPEVVRQALVASDGAELVEVEEAVAGRAPVVARPPAAEAPLVEELRGWAWMMLDRPGAPLAARIYLLGYLAEVVDALRAERGQDASVEALAEELEVAASEEALAALVEEQAAEAHGPEAASVILAAAVRLREVVRPPLRAEIERAIDTLADRGALERSGEELLIRERFAPAWRRRLRSLPRSQLGLLDGWLERLARDQVFKVRWAGAPAVGPWARALAIRLAMLRLLTVFHPDAERGAEAMAAWFVRLVSQSARVLEHHPEASAYVDVAEKGMRSVGAVLAYL